MSKDIRKYICSSPTCSFFMTIPAQSSFILKDCPDCGSPIVLEADHSQSWLEQIGNDDAFWAQGLDSWPSIIAHEYARVREFAQKNLSYAILLQMKDVFEVILKFETLVGFAYVKSLGFEDFDEFFANDLVSAKAMSFGDWIQPLGVNLMKYCKDKKVDCPVLPVLRKIHKYYQTWNIVNWRNDSIGHGALGYDENEEYRENISSHLSEMKTILDAIGPSLQEQTLSVAGIVLMGKEKARNLPREYNGEPCSISFPNGSSAPLDPFIVIERGGVYFFDSQYTRTLSSLLAYADGKKTREEVAYFARLRQMAESRVPYANGNIGNIDYTEMDDRELERIHIEHDFVTPTHLLHVVQKMINTHDKGVFLLQMGRGMGKSTFTDKLNRRFSKPCIIDEDLDVRTYHFQRIQQAGTEDFEYRLEQEWAQDFSKNYWGRCPRIRDLRNDRKLDNADSLAAFLQEVLIHTQMSRGCSRILMVLDGLDEIFDEKIWDYLPSGNALSDGVYILLTSRDPETEALPLTIRSHLQALNVDQSVRCAGSSEENKEFLKQYVLKTKVKHLASPENNAILEALMKKAEYRVLGVSLLCRLLEGHCDVSLISEPSSLIPQYILQIASRYGEKGSRTFFEMLTILCTVAEWEPLMLEEISTMMGDSYVSLLLIGMMRDITPLLKVIRGDSDAGVEDKRATLNHYTLANSDISKAVYEAIPADIRKDEIRDLIKVSLSVLKNWQGSYTGIEKAMVHFYDLAQLLPDPLRTIIPEEIHEWGSNAHSVWDNLHSTFDNRMKYQLLVNAYKAESLLFGKQNELTLETMFRLAYAISKSGKKYEALPIYQEVLQLSQKVLGPEHPDTLTVMNNLATTLIDLERYDEALTICQETLHLSQKALGPEHSGTLTSMHNLAAALDKMGRVDEALTIYQELLHLNQRILGPEHPNTLSAMHNLASTLHHLKRNNEALTLYQEVLQLSQKVLGPEHPDTLDSMTNLAVTLIDMGKSNEALPIFQENLQLSQKVFGPEHPDTLTSMNNLALALGDSGKNDEALTLYQEVLQLRQKVLGSEHPDTLAAMSNLSSLLVDMGKADEALTICQELLQLRRKLLGPDHPDTLDAMNNLAVTLNAAGKSNEALSICQEALQLTQKKLGPDHPDTLDAMNNLAFMLIDLGRADEALPILQDALQLTQKVLGPDHPDTLDTMKTLAYMLIEMGRVNEALPILQETLQLTQKIFGPEHPDTLDAMKTLAYVLRAMGRFDEALPILQETLQLTQKVLGPEHPDTLVAMNNLAYTLTEMGRENELLPIPTLPLVE